MRKQYPPIFYVYEHWRPDKGVCFYVGKGKERRAHDFVGRSRHHQNICAKLKSMGLVPEIKFVEINLTEAEAFELEVQRIFLWKSAGIVLTNQTNGGDGTSGFIWSEESRKVRSELSKKFMAERPDIRAKIRATLKGRK